MNSLLLSTLARCLRHAPLVLATGAAALAHAAPFEVAVSPSRFEVSAKSGARLGQSLDINNLGAAATEVSVRTIDWSYSADGEVAYFDALQPGSCRPWVTLERRTIKVPARGRASFRFQVEPPADASRGECRFMIAVEGVEPAYQANLAQGGTTMSLPVSGRIAVAVYVMVNGAEPKISLTQVGMKEVRGKRTAVATITNTGEAHGRLDGSLEATDARGIQFEMVPDGSPVMPGQTRQIALLPRGEQNKPIEPVYPIKVKGLLEWEKGGFKVDAELR